MNRLVQVGCVPLLAAAAIGVSGCGDTDSTPGQRTTTATESVTVEPTTPPPRSTPPTEPASPRATAPPASGAETVVREYFEAINAQDYQRAWDLGGSNLSGSYEDFVRGFATTADDSVRILGADGDTVTIRLEATQTDGSVRVFEGAYTVRGGAIVAADVREVSGPGSDPAPSESGAPVYDNCDEAQEARPGPIVAGEPGYGPHLDEDHDGIGCEEP